MSRLIGDTSVGGQGYVSDADASRTIKAALRKACPGTRTCSSRTHADHAAVAAIAQIVSQTHDQAEFLRDEIADFERQIAVDRHA
jgi:hypothetical protein